MAKRDKPLRSWLRDSLGLGRPLRTPTVLQTDAVECGAAALAMVLAHHGRRVSLEELRQDCGVSRDGSTAANLLRAARAHGLTASGLKLDLDQLAKEAHPVIVFWQFNHFLVFEGFAGKWAYLNDPATGPRRVSRAVFSQGYTGVALCCSPGPEFMRRAPPPVNFGRWRPVAASLLFILVASLALALPALAIPVFAQVFIDSVLIGRLDGWIRPLLLGMAITALLRGALTWLQRQALLQLELRLATAWSACFLWHVLRLPVSYFQQRQAADLVQRLSANDRMAQLLCGHLSTDAIAMLSMLLTVLIMLTYDVGMTLLCLALTALNLVALRGVARWRADVSLQWQTEHGVLMASLTGLLRSIESIKAGGAEASCFRRWTGQQARMVNTNLRLESMTNVLAALPFLIMALVTVAILWIGGHRIMAGEMTVGMLVGFQSLMMTLAAPVKNLMGIAGNFQQARASMRRVAEVLAAPLEPRFRNDDDRLVAALLPVDVHGDGSVEVESRPGSHAGKPGRHDASRINAAIPASTAAHSLAQALSQSLPKSLPNSLPHSLPLSPAQSQPLSPAHSPGYGSADAPGRISAQDSANAAPSAAVFDAGIVAGARLQGRLDLVAVSFGYNRLAPPLVSDFSLSLKPGGRIALVGRSGCGKSTVARLVTGEMAPWSGEILFDGKRREQIPPAVLQASVAGVDQDIHMFDGSVRDNLTLWDASIAEADMMSAAHDALIHEVIAARPLGYDALLGEDAADFSGGQRQRLEIARALTVNPRLLVLDEATASLDAIHELAIDDNLRRRGCSCLIIAHRLSTIRDCDEIIVMDGGRIAERGSHAQLLNMNGLYVQLLQEQPRPA